MDLLIDLAAAARAERQVAGLRARRLSAESAEPGMAGLIVAPRLPPTQAFSRAAALRSAAGW
jgi:hypothetical protein